MPSRLPHETPPPSSSCALTSPEHALTGEKQAGDAPPSALLHRASPSSTQIPRYVSHFHHVQARVHPAMDEFADLASGRRNWCCSHHRRASSSPIPPCAFRIHRCGIPFGGCRHVLASSSLGMNSKNPSVGSCIFAPMDEVPPLLHVVLHLGMVHLIHGEDWGLAEVLRVFYTHYFPFLLLR